MVIQNMNKNYIFINCIFLYTKIALDIGTGHCYFTVITNNKIKHRTKDDRKKNNIFFWQVCRTDSGE